MRRVHILVEGQTEAYFIGQVLGPHLAASGTYARPILIRTRAVDSGPDFRGGYVPYARIKKQILNLLGDTDAALVTTMLDYYGLPGDFPGYATRPQATCFDRIRHLEQAFYADVDDRRFLPYLSLHEFEAILFSAPERIAEVLAVNDMAPALRRIRASFNSPEEIDDEEPPSRRIQTLTPGYEKPLHGLLISSQIGLERIRNECSHFNEWIDRLEAQETHSL